jgi:hypothetical protein
MESTKETKPINDIRVGMNSRVRNVVRYCNGILNEKKATELKFSAVGGAIGRLVNVVEVLRIVNQGLHQTNKLGTVIHQTVDQQGGVENNRSYPKLEVVLSLDEPKEKGEGYQAPLPEDERTKQFDLLNAERPRRESFSRGGPRDGLRGRGFGDRGGQRGTRGGLRGSRGGFGEQRGGFRGSRGGFGEQRGGFRGSRGGFGEQRGTRGGFRGGFRGGRGAPRGTRGGFRGGRGAPRENREDFY